MTKAELEAANLALATESATLRIVLSELVEAVDGMDNLDEMDGPEFRETEAELLFALAKARPLTEAALMAKSFGTDD